jgi:hypothetical protein
MPFAGTFWLLWEDEPLNLETTRFFEFRDGKLFDPRTNQERGTYTEVEQGVDAVFDERYGEREVIKLRMTKQFAERNGQHLDVTPDFDPEADGYALTFSTVRYEEYLATRTLDPNETVEEADDRQDREMEDYGLVPMFGFGIRDGVEARQIGEENAALDAA